MESHHRRDLRRPGFPTAGWSYNCALGIRSTRSVFVVFRKPISSEASGQATTNYPVFAPVRNLSGPWVVSFDPKWGGPESVVFNTLADWTNRPENGIRYYSGTAVYRKSFTLDVLPVNGEHLMLDLGQVHEFATLRLNGKDLGDCGVNLHGSILAGCAPRGEQTRDLRRLAAKLGPRSKRTLMLVSASGGSRLSWTGRTGNLLFPLLEAASSPCGLAGRQCNLKHRSR